MSLSDGARLGVYEITGSIGAGGMGEVYRAHDTKLGRDVTIKTLPAALASDKDRLARFEREAKLLAALNHAHIASVYGLDEHEGTLYLAMELVEGETLEERLKKRGGRRAARRGLTADHRHRAGGEPRLVGVYPRCAAAAREPFRTFARERINELQSAAERR